MIQILIFDWNPDLSIGIDLLDSQHKEIFEKANAFFIANKVGAPSKRLAECLEFLEQYVLYHFQAEEAFQAEKGYPKRREHQAMHQALLIQFKFHSTALYGSNFSQISIDGFYKFLREWIEAHILREDTKFARYNTRRQAAEQNNLS